ncbi:hypothetical protein BJ742DRAFT_810527 [Cladochytrium replicatum]|nr:hypothetical protein BJ742DRAFT_810527 [Cladochytrium replicatum]
MPLPLLKSEIKLGSVTLKNRVVLASLTRDRNGPNRVPQDVNAEYYAQRAGAGLVMTEATLISEQGVEWANAPGIFSESQIEGWSKVAKAVHDKGSVIFMQLWHIGRVAHPGMDANGSKTVSPSGIGAKGGKFRLLEGSPGYLKNPAIIEDPWKYVGLFEHGAKNAIAAGMDGVEVHCANGYLVHQFIESHSNTRTDEWGGSPEKRAKFAIEAVKASIRGVGGDSKRVGVKLTPCGGLNDMGDPEDVLIAEYSYLITELDKLNIGYIQLTRYWPLADATSRGTPVDVVKLFRPLIKNALVMVNGGFTGDEAEAFVKSGKADLVGFGLAFISSPDLPQRLFNGYPLNNALDPTTFYGKNDVPNSRGYTDLPVYEEWVKSLTLGKRTLNNLIPYIFGLITKISLYKTLFNRWWIRVFGGEGKKQK